MCHRRIFWALLVARYEQQTLQETNRMVRFGLASVPDEKSTGRTKSTTRRVICTYVHLYVGQIKTVDNILNTFRVIAMFQLELQVVE